MKELSAAALTAHSHSRGEKWDMERPLQKNSEAGVEERVARAGCDEIETQPEHREQRQPDERRRAVFFIEAARPRRGEENAESKEPPVAFELAQEIAGKHALAAAEEGIETGEVVPQLAEIRDAEHHPRLRNKKEKIETREEAVTL